MSWYRTGTIDTMDEEWRGHLRHIEAEIYTPEEVTKEQEQAVKWATATVEDAVDCAIVGAEGNIFYYTISGHANPDNQPREGWAFDSVTITLVQGKRQ